MSRPAAAAATAAAGPSSAYSGRFALACVFILGLVAGHLLSSYTASPSIELFTESNEAGNAFKPNTHVKLRSAQPFVSTPRNIFFDFGSNDGSSIEFFLDGNMAGTIHSQGGDQQSPLRGMGSNGTWEVVALEANIAHTPKLKLVQQKFVSSNKVSKFYLFDSTAIATFDGNITFYIDKRVGSTGSSIVKESAAITDESFEVTAIHPLSLFHRLKVRHQDNVVVKMDIEGAEYDVLRHMLTSGVVSKIDALAIEWHTLNLEVFPDGTELQKLKIEQQKCLEWMMQDEKAARVAWG